MKETELLFDLLKKGVSPVQAVRACKERLESAGFLELPYDEPWKLQKNGRYYLNHHDTTLFAFTVGEGWQETKTPQIRMAAAHTDFREFQRWMFQRFSSSDRPASGHEFRLFPARDSEGRETRRETASCPGKCCRTSDD